MKNKTNKIHLNYKKIPYINLLIWKIIFIVIFILIIIYNFYFSLHSLNFKNNKLNYPNKNIDILTSNTSFIIIKFNNNDKIYGLFTYFKFSLNCINTFINKGYIPIIDILSSPNIFNGFNNSSLNKNPWELFFEQPFGYSLEEVKKKAQNIIYFNFSYRICKEYGRKEFIYNKVTLDYWHMIFLKYIPIKNFIINESNYIINKLFKNSKNVLGILLRGTDYISIRPKGHPIQPNIEMVINDVIVADKKNKYDYLFLTTEDSIINQKFKSRFGNKIKNYKNTNINYNYKEKKFLAFNKNILGNSNYQKNYLMNIIILSKCIDIISSISSGTIGALVLSKGFRNAKLYNLGLYN